MTTGRRSRRPVVRLSPQLYFKAFRVVPTHRASVADRSSIPQKRSVVREPPVNSHRRRSIEPREEGQFLHVVSESVLGIENGRRQCPAQWIAYLKVGLTPGYLSRVAPRRGWIVAKRIVRPLAHLVRRNRHVWDRAHENLAGVKIGRSKRLLAADRVVEPENAARPAVQRRAPRVPSFAFNHIVKGQERVCSYENTAASGGSRSLAEWVLILTTLKNPNRSRRVSFSTVLQTAR